MSKFLNGVFVGILATIGLETWFGPRYLENKAKDWRTHVKEYPTMAKCWKIDPETGEDLEDLKKETE